MSQYQRDSHEALVSATAYPTTEHAEIHLLIEKASHIQQEEAAKRTRRDQEARSRINRQFIYD